MIDRNDALAKAGSLILCLLEPHLELLLGYPQVLDVGGGTVQKISPTSETGRASLRRQ